MFYHDFNAAKLLFLNKKSFMYRSISVGEFLNNLGESVLIDVRSEGEFEQGHLPGSCNLPLLNNEERAIVGTIYKKEGNRAAVKRGFELVGGKFAEYITKAADFSNGKSISIYCWRGGMRSNIMAWLFATAGFKVQLLKGGYKAYRRLVLDELNKARSFKILGGKTGSGKTIVLQEMKKLGVQVIDLESLACHRGSAFGGVGLAAQPSNEQFENELFSELSHYKSDEWIWLENESRLIGKIKIPDFIYDQMRKATVVELIVPTELRAKHIVQEYGVFPQDQLAEITKSIEKKLGNLRMKQALEFLEANDLINWAKVLLTYYDNFYAYGMSLRPPASITEYNPESMNFKEIACKLSALFNEANKDKEK